jgi:hypothetical protein
LLQALLFGDGWALADVEGDGAEQPYIWVSLSLGSGSGKGKGLWGYAGALRTRGKRHAGWSVLQKLKRVWRVWTDWEPAKQANAKWG